MQLADIYTQLEQESKKLETLLTPNTKKTQSKSSMIWMTEFDGKRYRLVAKWVPQD